MGLNSLLPFPRARRVEEVVVPVPASPRPGPRYLVVHLPAFRLERCGYLADEVAALVAERKSATRLVALTPAARALGLRLEMTATEARALVPEVVLEPLEPLGEAEDRVALSHAFLSLSDRAVPLGDDGVLLEVSGSAHLFGGEPGVLVEARRLATGLGHVCRLAISSDPLASAALATWGADDAVVPHPALASALAPLPVEALLPSPELALALRAIGVRRVGELSRLDRASLAGRFGAEGVRLHRVANGERAGQWLWDAVERPPVQAEAVLGGPATVLAPILFVLPGLLARVSAELSARDEAATRVCLRLVLDHGPARLVRVRLGRPTASPSRMEQLIRTRFDGLVLSAPVIGLSVEVEESCPDAGWQPGLLDRSERPEELPDLVARLSDTLGADAVFGVRLRDVWRPEAAWAPSPLEQAGPAPPRRMPRGKVDPVERAHHREHALPCPRPVALLAHPALIEVAAEGVAPARVRLDGLWHEITRAEGPEELSGEWWTGQGFARSYWAVALGDRAAWIYRDASGRWYLHGWF